MTKQSPIVVIDNYDSFTYNLVQYLGEISRELPTSDKLGDLQVYRNDRITLAEIKALDPAGIVISPGPGRPEDAGVSLDLIAQLGPTYPILGVCLGHQSIGQIYGGDVIRAPELMHGKTSPVHHNNTGVFNGLEDPFVATRYHSLIVDRDTCPDCLEITAWLADGTIMGLRHREYRHIQGVQFHPESILTVQGKQLLKNFLESL
jgi:anthranilate synthase component II